MLLVYAILSIVLVPAGCGASVCRSAAGPSIAASGSVYVRYALTITGFVAIACVCRFVLKFVLSSVKMRRERLAIFIE